MEQKKQVSREHLTSLLAKFIKDCQKKMGDKNYMKLPISIENWNCGMGRNSKWSHTDIIVGDYQDKKTYTFTDREITDEQFVNMLNRAIVLSCVRGRVFADEYGDGYWTPRQTIFRRIEISAKPCKEFVSLCNYLKKYSSCTLGELDVFNVNVCGKRSSWSDTGRYDYLCYNTKKCKEILDTIKAKRTSKDKLSVKVDEYFSHGDETEYKIAQYQESEWYGYRGGKLYVSIITPSGKVKLVREFYC